jgi:hypothetical protein
MDRWISLFYDGADPAFVSAKPDELGRSFAAEIRRIGKLQKNAVCGTTGVEIGMDYDVLFHRIRTASSGARTVLLNRKIKGVGFWRSV